MRQMIFVSHANPEDNEFALWLALRLASEGYAVWCDLTKLLGGEDFWKDIEAAIRDRTIKFLYVLSRTSNRKEGPLKELSVAEKVARNNPTLRDFIIPLRIDQLPFDDIQIQIIRLYAVDFTVGWATGLKNLLKKLAGDGVPKDSRFTPEAVASWWNTQFTQSPIVRAEPEGYVSNWYPVRALPPELHAYIMPSGAESQEGESATPVYPSYRVDNILFSFAPPQDLGVDVSLTLTGRKHTRTATDSFLESGMEEMGVDSRMARTVVTRLLRLAWEKMIRDRKLPTYELSGRVRSVYFQLGFSRNDEVQFTGPDGQPSRRALVGYKTMTNSATKVKHKRYWHFGIHVEPFVYPLVALAIKPHVVFSDDGKTVAGTPAVQHRARRSQCKDWWNDDWRDRVLAAMKWLGGDQGVISLPVSSGTTVDVLVSPVEFKCPVSYRDEDAVSSGGDADLAEHDAGPEVEPREEAE